MDIFEEILRLRREGKRAGGYCAGVESLNAAIAASILIYAARQHRFS